MPNFILDTTLDATILVEAPDENTARQMLHDVIGAEVAQANLGAWPNGDPCLAAVQIKPYARVTLLDAEVAAPDLIEPKQSRRKPPKGHRFTNGWDGERTTGTAIGTIWWDYLHGSGDVTLSPEFDAMDYVSKIDALQDAIGLMNREKATLMEAEAIRWEAERLNRSIAEINAHVPHRIVLRASGEGHSTPTASMLTRAAFQEDDGEID
jgi:hypothetical protein